MTLHLSVPLRAVAEDVEDDRRPLVPDQFEQAAGWITLVIHGRFVSFEKSNDKVTARFEGGREVVCDLLVAADGPGSMVRQQLLPTVQSEYAGYVTWRGVLLEHQASDLAAEFADRFIFFQAPHTHILCYLIPGPDGSLMPGHRRINWVWYLNAAPGEELDRVLTDKNDRRREFSVPQGFVAPDMLGWPTTSCRQTSFAWSRRPAIRSSKRSTTSPCRTWPSSGPA